MKKRLFGLALIFCIVLTIVPMIPIAAGNIAVGDLAISPTVAGDTLIEDTDYTYADNVLTICSAKAVTISGTTTEDRIVVASGVSANITLAGVNIDVSSGDDNCAFEITKDSTGSVTITLADGTENTLKSGNYRARLEKEGMNGSLTIRCAHSGETGHICDTATCGTLAASSTSGAGIGSGYASGDSGAVSNITIVGGNVTASSTDGAGIGSGYSIVSGDVSNITIVGGNVTASSTYGAGIGSGDGDSRSGDVSDITVSGGSVKASGVTAIGTGHGAAVQPTNGAGNDVYLYKIANADGAAVTINGKAYPTAHSYYDSYASEWMTKTTIYPYLPADSAQAIKVGDSTSTKVFNSTTNTFETAVVQLLSGTTVKGYYSTLDAALTAAAAGDTLKLLDDITLTATIKIDKQLTLDLNGKTVSRSGISLLIKVETSGDLTIRDSGTGGKIAARDFSVVQVYGNFTLEGGTLETTYVALWIGADATATLKGGTVKGSLQNNSGKLYADGGEVIGGSTNINNGTITRHTDATGTTKFYGNIVNGVGNKYYGTIDAGDFYGNVTNYYGGTITGGTFNGTVTNYYNNSSSTAGIIKPAAPGSIVINGALVFRNGKNGIDGTTTVDVTKEYLTDTLKLGGSGYVQVGDTYYILGASGIHAAATAAASGGGTLLLMNNVTIDKTLAISGRITLDLDGYTLKYESETDGSVIKVISGANFTLMDSSAAKTGTVTGGHVYEDMTAGGVYIHSANFTMNGGKITNCSGDGGGVIVYDGTFTMNAGSITDCSGQISNGVNLYDRGTFIMNGGSINHPNSDAGTAVYLDGYFNPTFIMSGGSIYGNVQNILGEIKNDSTTGATIVYGGLQNEGTITGKLVKFMDGENIYAWEIVPTGGKIVSMPTLPQKANHIFGGWYEKENGELKANAFEFANTTVTGEITLHAFWISNTYPVTLDPMGGTINGGSITEYAYGTGATLPTDVKKEGYTFAGWYDNSGLKGDPVTAIGATELGAKEYWAKWVDSKAPTVSGIENGKTYCSAVSFTVSDNIGVTSVSLNGAELQAVNGVYTVAPAAGEQTVTVSDAAGNETEIKITVNSDHTWQNGECIHCTIDCKHPTTVTVGYKPANHVKQWAGESGVTSCTVCGEVLRENTKIAPSAHRGGKEYASSDTEHWKTCTYSGCDAEVKNTREAHTPNEDGVCTTCGYKKTADYLRGDFDNNGIVGSDDAIYLLRHVFFGEQYPVNQPADLNNDGLVTSDDAIYLLRHVFFPETYPL